MMKKSPYSGLSFVVGTTWGTTWSDLVASASITFCPHNAWTLQRKRAIAPAFPQGAVKRSLDPVAGVLFVVGVEVSVARGFEQGNRYRSAFRRIAGFIEPLREVAFDLGDFCFNATLDRGHVPGQFGIGDSGAWWWCFCHGILVP
jgi:hypothetical protein